MNPFFTACLGVLFLLTQAFAHGTHATFISPDKGALVSNEVKVHIKKVAHPFPYVRIIVQNRSTGNNKWSGLVPLSDLGYVQTIDVEGWDVGTYIIEAQIIGDIVEQTQHRFITVGRPE